MEKMKTVLSVKEESLRKLKQDLRSQHQGEESCKSFRLLTSDLSLISLVSCQQEETTKWKNRAISLKGKSKAEQDRMTSPCTPKKRALCPTSDSTLLFSPTKKSYLPPKRALDSPRKPLVSAASLLDSPKSSFFNAGEGSELLTRNYPTQFFDNSNLGIKPAFLRSLSSCCPALPCVYFGDSRVVCRLSIVGGAGDLLPWFGALRSVISESHSTTTQIHFSK
uniref:Uncharacterized protein n=1 Tax=Xiphophorus maculatus TaxID=8083 RepID=A0A3B5QTZ1_XIPMA